MPSGKTQTIVVSPEVLKYFRFSAHIRKEIFIEHFQKKSKLKFHVDASVLEEIESTERPLSVGLLNELAALYKIPITCFFLSKPLKDDPIPPDYRKKTDAQNDEISPDTVLAIRAARRSQYITNLIRGTWESAELPEVNLNQDPEKVANNLRSILALSLDEQIKIKNSYNLFNILRNRIESLGILVLKTSFPVDDARAFSLSDSKPYVVVINNKDGTDAGYSPKIFSLLHEFGHILLKTGGLCNDFSYDNTQKNERFCNALAAAFLLPNDDFRDLLKDVDFSALDEDSMVELVEKLRKRYKVSGEVVIRRMNNLGLISWDKSDNLIEDWNDYLSGFERNKFIPKLSQSQRCVQRNGPLYTKVVMRGVSSGLITPEIATDSLGIKLKHFYELGRLAG